MCTESFRHWIGFVHISASSPACRRVQRLSITATATAAAESLRLALVEQIFGMLSEKERGQLDAILAKLARAIGEQEAEKAL